MLQIFLCGRNYPGIDIDVAFSAEPRKFAILKDLKEFRLQGDIDFANFIQENGSAIGQLEFPRFFFGGPGERSPFKTEQLAFHQFSRDGSTVDFDKGFVFPRRFVVDGPGDEFFSGSAFPLDQYGNVSRGDLVDYGLLPLHLGTIGKEKWIGVIGYYFCHHGAFSKN